MLREDDFISNCGQSGKFSKWLTWFLSGDKLRRGELKHYQLSSPISSVNTLKTKAQVLDLIVLISRMVNLTLFPRTLNRTLRLFSLSLSLSLLSFSLFYSHSYCLSFSLSKEWDSFRSVLPSSQIQIILYLQTRIYILRIQVPAGAWKHGFERLQCWDFMVPLSFSLS